MKKLRKILIDILSYLPRQWKRLNTYVYCDKCTHFIPPTDWDRKFFNSLGRCDQFPAMVEGTKSNIFSRLDQKEINYYQSVNRVKKQPSCRYYKFKKMENKNAYQSRI